VGAEKDVKEKGLLRRVIIDFYIWFRNMLGKEERTGGKRNGKKREPGNIKEEFQGSTAESVERHPSIPQESVNIR